MHVPPIPQRTAVDILRASDPSFTLFRATISRTDTEFILFAETIFEAQRHPDIVRDGFARCYLCHHARCTALNIVLRPAPPGVYEIFKNEIGGNVESFIAVALAEFQATQPDCAEALVAWAAGTAEPEQATLGILLAFRLFRLLPDPSAT